MKSCVVFLGLCISIVGPGSLSAVAADKALIVCLAGDGTMGATFEVDYQNSTVTILASGQTANMHVVVPAQITESVISWRDDSYVAPPVAGRWEVYRSTGQWATTQPNGRISAPGGDCRQTKKKF